MAPPMCNNIVAPAGLGYASPAGTGDEFNATWMTPNIFGAADDLDAFDYSPAATAALTGVYFSLKAIGWLLDEGAPSDGKTALRRYAGGLYKVRTSVAESQIDLSPFADAIGARFFWRDGILRRPRWSSMPAT